MSLEEICEPTETAREGVRTRLPSLRSNMVYTGLCKCFICCSTVARRQQEPRVIQSGDMKSALCFGVHLLSQEGIKARCRFLCGLSLQAPRLRFRCCEVEFGNILSAARHLLQLRGRAQVAASPVSFPRAWGAVCVALFISRFRPALSGYNAPRRPSMYLLQ
jgi:hypothetical protein